MKAIAIRVENTFTPPIAHVVTVVRRRLCLEAGRAENLVGVVNDGVDARYLLEDCKSQPDHERAAPLAAKDFAPGRLRSVRRSKPSRSP